MATRDVNTKSSYGNNGFVFGNTIQLYPTSIPDGTSLTMMFTEKEVWCASGYAPKEWHGGNDSLYKVPLEELAKMSAEEKASLGLGSPASGPAPPIPRFYTDPEQSGLTYTVTAGKQTHDIELK